MKKVALWTFGILGFLIVLGVVSGERNKDGATAPQDTVSTETLDLAAPEEPSEPREPYNSPEISMAEFQQIQSGMSYEEVTKIIGGPGTLVSDSDIAGYRTVMFAYEGESGLGANANVMFQNNKMIQKAQFGLR